MKRRALLASLLLCIPFAMPVFAQPAPGKPPVKTIEINRAAKVVLVHGDVTAKSAGGQKRALVSGEAIVEGDSIETGKDGELHLDMEDGGYISVRPNTRMRIVKYQANGEDTDNAWFSLLEGSFRSVTGWIGKFNADKYTVRSRNVTVGIRGTDHEPFVIPAGSTQGDAGTYDKVNEGASFIQNAAGRIDASMNQIAFVPDDAKARPRLLAALPKHFRPGRFEDRFIGKHAEIRARIDARREARRADIRQRLLDAKSRLEVPEKLRELRDRRLEKAKPPGN